MPRASTAPLHAFVGCILGVHEVKHSAVAVRIMLAKGVLGDVPRPFDVDPAPRVLGLVIAPILEMSLRQSLVMSNRHRTIVVLRPIAAVLVVLVAGLLVRSAASLLRRRRDWPARLAAEEAGDTA
ncbi:hypothetical protein [Rhodoplanes azumiensis]|uniref:Uncharacterized protein n=1 Tax=Rhodoplanes azumiensis TaxID=1897628 RepID=A0ABW5AL13_9BRAD